MITIIFAATDKEKIWETDYIIQLLSNKMDQNIEKIFISFEQIEKQNIYCDVFVYNCRMHSFDQILNVVKKIKPKIIFHLSDEYYYENLGHYNELAKYCNLFLRQHHHPGYVYEDNVIPMPLGYCNDAGIGGRYIPKINERNYNWSFIGDMKNDRWEMVNAFYEIENYFAGSQILKPDMMNIYLDSIFVPCGRGNSSINCFRLYEASMAGAIPICVGSKEEIDLVFKYEENPPWIFAESWKESVEICKKFLAQKNLLQEKQFEILNWWKNRIDTIMERITIALDKKHMDHIYEEPQFGEPWFSYPNLYSSMVEKFSTGSKFVEVGSWKGKSAAYMAVEIVNSNKDIQLYCVDTWTGSREHQNREDIDELYNIFIDNMKPIEEYYSPMRMTSLEAASMFEDNSLDFVFLDASHHYEDVKDDINAWLPKVKNGGVLSGHDYVGWWSVKNAVDELIPNFKVSEKCWIHEVVKTEMIAHIYEEHQFGENWFGYQTVYSNAVKRFSTGSKFVEVGSWKGKSSSYMAVEIANSKKDIDFYCVDTWQGSVEHQEDDQYKLSELYDVFIGNMKPVENYYIPIKITSLEASKKFKDNSLDFVFLDSSHTYEDVKADIAAWLPKVKPGGILAGHDYYVDGEDWFPEVKQAVNEMLDDFDKIDNCFVHYKKDLNKLNNFPPVHFISVDDCVERRELLYKKFEEYGIGNITPHIYKRYNDDDHVIESKLLDRLSIGSRGPVTSHLKAIREWYENTDEEVAFFCEDDLSLETIKYWNFTWEEFYNNLPTDWGCIQLAWIRENFHQFLVEFRNRCWCDWSACAYLITRSHVKKLIDNYYYDDIFHLDLRGDYVEDRPITAQIPVVETIMFSQLSKIYGVPMFVEDVINCKSSYLSLVGNQVNGQCDVYHYESYKNTIEWWRSVAQNLTVAEFIKI